MRKRRDAHRSRRRSPPARPTSQAGEARHDRALARDRGARRRVLTRSRWPAPPEARSRRAPRTRSSTGIRLLAETEGVFTETAGGVTIAVLKRLVERGVIATRRGDRRVRDRQRLQDDRCPRGPDRAQLPRRARSRRLPRRRSIATSPDGRARPLRTTYVFLREGQGSTPWTAQQTLCMLRDAEERFHACGRRWPSIAGGPVLLTARARRGRCRARLGARQKGGSAVRRHRPIRVMAALLASVFVMAACGGGDDGGIGTATGRRNDPLRVLARPRVELARGPGHPRGDGGRSPGSRSSDSSPKTSSRSSPAATPTSCRPGSYETPVLESENGVPTVTIGKYNMAKDIVVVAADSGYETFADLPEGLQGRRRVVQRLHHRLAGPGQGPRRTNARRGSPDDLQMAITDFDLAPELVLRATCARASRRSTTRWVR